jgi:hypothetical protein
MPPVTVLLVRLAAALGFSYFLNVFYFGGFNLMRFIALAAFMLAVAYAFEALRGRKSK